MDTVSVPPTHRPDGAWRPEGADRIALVLQGGGALGAYQAGVYQALHEAGLEPDWLAGVSIGGINSAIIAGNRPEHRLERLREFWETITARHVWFYTPDGDDPRKARNSWSSLLTLMQGQPGFFTPNTPNPWLSPRGAKTATSFYDNAPLRETLLRLVDFDLLNSKTTRYACGAVNVANGNFSYFDSTQTVIEPEHIMASGALPPALPMVRIGTDYFWDGGLVSNTPLQWLLENAGPVGMIVFQVDLFSAQGALPRDMYDVLARQKDIQYSSRTRLVTDYFRHQQHTNTLLKRVLDKLPETELDDEMREARQRLAAMPEINILHLIYQQLAYEGQAKDYEFSGTSMREHWDAGYRDTQRTLSHKDWLRVVHNDGGVVVHDVHHSEP
ncbi:MAG TPA: patatin-like phospholipase family protein [Acetobacteraceae bacterium]|jgi:NTE family protein|nr:patatin-like phospholipase family protein [Acetobacteraceae bacterium]